MKDKKNHNVRDHCHYTGEYRGAAQSIYNLKCSVPNKIPKAFHNGSNYDYHFIMPNKIPIAFHNGSNYGYRFIIKGLTAEFKK